MKLEQKDIENKLLSLEDWKFNRETQIIFKKYTFNNFKSAFLWMTYISEEAEKLNHHPEWKNIYNTVEVVLTTHDILGLSNKDFILALFMDKEFKKFL